MALLRLLCSLASSLFSLLLYSYADLSLGFTGALLSHALLLTLLGVEIASAGSPLGSKLTFAGLFSITAAAVGVEADVIAFIITSLTYWWMWWGKRLWRQDVEGSSDVVVSFRPFEEEIRSFLSRHEPRKLCKVDQMLDTYSGREKELLAKIKLKYGKREEPSPASAVSAPDIHFSQSTTPSTIRSSSRVLKSPLTPATPMPPPGQGHSTSLDQARDEAIASKERAVQQRIQELKQRKRRQNY